MNILYLAHRIPYPPNKGDKLRSFHQLQYLARGFPPLPLGPGLAVAREGRGEGFRSPSTLGRGVRGEGFGTACTPRTRCSTEGCHRVWCACFIDDPHDWQYVPAIRDLCVDVAAFDLRPYTARWRAFRNLVAGRTATCGYFADPRMSAALSAWQRKIKFDAVVAFSSSMAPYALQVPAARHVLDLCDCDSQKWLDYARASLPPMRWLYQLEGRRLSEFENACAQKFSQTIVISDAEAACLLTTSHTGGPRGRKEVRQTEGTCMNSHSDESHGCVRVIANGVTIPRVTQLRGTNSEPAREPVVGFVGALNYRPNVDAVCWFAKACWPAILAARPAATFRVIGHSPVRAIRRLARIPGMEILGPVHDIAPEIHRFDLSVAPLRIARGLQNKVLEAMAFAKPVVLTAAAAEGIPGRNGRHFVIADQPDRFARAVVNLLSDSRARTALGRSARRLVSRHYRWEPLLREFERAVTGAAAAKQARSISCEGLSSLHNAPAVADLEPAALPMR